MSMFEAIKYVGSPIALLAFVTAVMAVIYRERLKQRIAMIKATEETQRGDLIKELEDVFHIEVGDLTKQQRFDLAVKRLDQRAARYLIGSIVAILLALILASAVVIVVVADAGKGKPAEPVSNSNPVAVSPKCVIEKHSHDNGSVVLGFKFVDVAEDFHVETIKLKLEQTSAITRVEGSPSEKVEAVRYSVLITEEALENAAVDVALNGLHRSSGEPYVFTELVLWFAKRDYEVQLSVVPEFYDVEGNQLELAIPSKLPLKIVLSNSRRYNASAL